MKKLLIFLLAAALCFPLMTVQAEAATEDKSSQAAAVLSMMGAIQGDGSGSLGLSGTLTRAQFCKIAVVVTGLSKSISQYSGYTIFPDVQSSSWAAGYVNIAVRSAGIMSGYLNGAFGPDDTMTYGQAVTVLMRMLGYTNTDVGAKWPDNYLEKADEIGLTDGVTLSSNAGITKGDVAILFVNLLNADMNGSANAFIETISGATAVSDVFLVSLNAEADNGVTGAIEVAGSNNAVYIPVNTVPEELIGAYGTLVVNNEGKALVFIPVSNGSTVVSTVVSASAAAIKCADGTTISMTSSPNFFYNGTSAEYSDAWISIEGGMLVSVHYSSGGSVENVLVSTVSSGTAVASVVMTDTYALPYASFVYINGNAATASDILKYDVVSYDEDFGVCNITRCAITGRYDAAYPNTENPERVTVMGTEFGVLDSAASTLANFDVGSSITLLLTADNQVAGAVAGSALSCSNYGVVKSLTASDATVTLFNGVTVSGEVENVSSSIGVGTLVTVGAYQKDILNISAVSETTSSSRLELSTGKLGTYSLSKALTVYECVGKSTVIEIALSDIPALTVDSAKIKFVAYDSSGSVCLVLLSDVTGDCYTYGVIENDTVTETVGPLSATYATICVTNSEGTSTPVFGSTPLYTGEYAGIASTGGGDLAGYTTLTDITNISRSDFQQGSDGLLYVSAAGGLIPVSDEVQAYIVDSDTWTTLANARSYSDNLTIYYDRTLSTGGKVRVVVAN